MQTIPARWTMSNASDEEIRYLCDAANRYFEHDITPDDVVHTYAGVRALVDDGSGRPEAASRGYELALSDAGRGAPILGIYGGKITSYRHVAQDAVEKLAERLPVLKGKGWTATTPLPGGDIDKHAQPYLFEVLGEDYPFLSADDVVRIGRAYGTRAVDWLGDAKSWDDLGRAFGAGLSEAEVTYLRENEWAQTAEDILWRRSKLGLHMSDGEAAGLAAIQAARLPAYRGRLILHLLHHRQHRFHLHLRAFAGGEFASPPHRTAR